jgi:hypothetical protein
LANQISFIPRGAAARYYIPAPLQRIQVLQNPETYDGLISDMVRGGAVHLEPSRPISDPLVSQISRRSPTKWRVVSSIDALNTALAVQMMRQFVDPSAIM